MDVHAALPPSPLPSLASDLSQRWSEASSSRRPKSQTTSSHREHSTRRKRSPNEIRARPANAAVISNIISSLETFTPASNGVGSSGQHGASPRSRSSTGGSRSNRSSLPAMSLTSSFGVEYGTGVAMDDYDGISDAALPPTIRTTRAPSGKSNYSRSRSPSTTSSTTERLRPASTGSRRSSWSGRSKEVVGGAAQGGKGLSAESWIRAYGVSQESLESRGSRRSDGTGSVRRMSSYDTFRQERKVAIPEEIVERPDSAGEEIVLRTSPSAKTSKGRLYLTDSTIDEERIASASPNSVITHPEIVDSPRKASKKPAQSSPQRPLSPVKASPMQSPIIDSIPLRTSSLRPTKSPKQTKRKKDKKRSRLGESKERDRKPSPMARNGSINETSWAELGDDDETVKRIRQLKQQREDRIRESTSDLSPIVSPMARMSQAINVSAHRSEDTRRTIRSRPKANRASTEPPTKAHKLLGITDDGPAAALSGSNGHLDASSPSNISTETDVRCNHSVDGRRPPPSPLKLVRPPTADSSTPHLSLDYSYAQAVDALQGTGSELARSKRRSDMPAAGKEQQWAVDQTITSALRDDNKLAPQTTSEQLKKPKNIQRWTTNHPDLPVDLEKRKSRRKSMSDARKGNVFVEEHEPVPRRDSIEDSVLEYLRDARLSRKLRSAITRRTISYSEVGDPDGAAVFICVGMGLTRFVTAFYDELAITLRLRLITIDRPGVGASDPYPAHDRTGPLGWPDDVLAICQELDITRFSILAHSAGAIYALATALILPQMVKGKVHLLAPWIPPSQLEVISHPTSSAPPAGALPRSQRLLRVLPTPFLKVANSSFINATSASLKPDSKRQVKATKEAQRQASLSPGRQTQELRPPCCEGSTDRPDYNRRQSLMAMDQHMPAMDPRAMDNFPVPLNQSLAALGNPKRSSVILSATASPTDPAFNYAATALNAAEHAEHERQIEYTSRLTQRTWELAIRDSNPATDLLVCLERHRDVGFRYVDVNVETVITHGSEDKRVPVGNVKWLAEQMNRRAMVGRDAELEAGEAPRTRERWERGRSGCEVRVLQGEGHGLMASPSVMGECLTEIAGYWARDGARGRSAI